MIENKLRPVMLALLAILAVGVLTFAISPDVRARIGELSIMQPFVDGVVIDTSDPDTLTISRSVVGEEDTDNIPLEDMEPVSDSELAEKYSEFVLPTNVPAGYTFDSPVKRIYPDVLVATWNNDAGNEIVYYYWGYMNAYAPEGKETELADGSIDVEFGAGEGHIFDYGVQSYIRATDMSLTEADLEAMLP